MIVRCGRCQVSLEVSGPGEFACPACGTRNVVRGGGSGQDLGTPLTPGGQEVGYPQGTPEDEPPDIRWVNCPTCAYRFAVGAVEAVACPSCAAPLTVTEKGVELREE